MGYAAELIMDVDDDVWSIAGDTFGLIFVQTCANADDKRPPPATSPSPDLRAAQDGAKNVIGAALQGAYDDDAVSTVGGVSILAEDSRSTVWQEDLGSEGQAYQKESLQAVREKARMVLEEAAQNGTLGVAMTDVMNGKTPKALDAQKTPAGAEEVRLTTQSSLMEGLATGRLDAVLAEVYGRTEAASPTPSDLDDVISWLVAGKTFSSAFIDAVHASTAAAGCKPIDDEEFTCDTAREALLKGLENGRLDALLAEAAKHNDVNDEEIRILMRTAIEEGRADGRLDAALAQSAAQTTGFVPQPPPGGPPSAAASPSRSRRLLSGGSSAEKMMQMISDADRKVGSLTTKVQDKERQIKERDACCQKLTENIQFARNDLEHLSIDLNWHEEQIQLAGDRYSSLNEGRRTLALKLDEMRLKGVKDEWPAGPKPSQTARSLNSTATGGASTAIEGSYSGWNTERSAIQTFVTQNGPGHY